MILRFGHRQTAWRGSDFEMTCHSVNRSGSVFAQIRTYSARGQRDQQRLFVEAN
jgi:hypothetical protein